MKMTKIIPVSKVEIDTSLLIADYSLLFRFSKILEKFYVQRLNNITEK